MRQTDRQKNKNKKKRTVKVKVADETTTNAPQSPAVYSTFALELIHLNYPNGQPVSQARKLIR